MTTTAVRGPKRAPRPGDHVWHPRPDGSGAALTPQQVLLALAVVRLADRIIGQTWHTGWPHSERCHDFGCRVIGFRKLMATCDDSTRLILMWRKAHRFGMRAVAWDTQIDLREPLTLLRDGVPVADVFGDLDLLWGRLKVFAARLRIDDAGIGPAVHAYAASVLAVIIEVREAR